VITPRAGFTRCRPSDPGTVGFPSIPLGEIDASDRLSRWSPDGNRLYFFSNRDGSDCVWVQQLNPATKRPVGSPQALYHLHSARRAILAFPAMGFSVARDKAVLPLRELTGNIWMAAANEVSTSPRF
jgi:hypothetical protein